MAEKKKRRGRPRKTKLIDEKVNTPEVKANEMYADSPVQVRNRAPQRMRQDFVDLKDKGQSSYLVRDTEKDLQRHQRKGYEIVRPEEVENMDGTADRTDNVVRFGDRVAMRIPKDVRQQWHDEKARKHRERDGKLQHAAELMSSHNGESGMYAGEDKRTRGPLHNIPVEFND